MHPLEGVTGDPASSWFDEAAPPAYTSRVKSFAYLGLVGIGLVAACSGAAPTELFDTSTSPSATTSPTTTATLSPTTTAPTTSPTDEPPIDVDAAVPPSDECTAEKPGCGAGEVCQLPGCTGKGKCVAASAFGTDPVCGCDKLTYASIALARNNVAYRGSGECTKDAATPCTGSCSGGAKCNLRMSSLACLDNSGTCWRMPSACPPAAKGFRLCGTATCASACEAVSQNKKYFQDGLCP